MCACVCVCVCVCACVCVVCVCVCVCMCVCVVCVCVCGGVCVYLVCVCVCMWWWGVRKVLFMTGESGHLYYVNVKLFEGLSVTAFVSVDFEVVTVEFTHVRSKNKEPHRISFVFVCTRTTKLEHVFVVFKYKNQTL